MKVAVIICTRNRGHLIKDALDSILAGEFREYLLHVVDQSTDRNTRDLVEQYLARDPRVRYHPLAAKGLSIARNHGFRAAADADLIVYTDDDVRVDPYWLKAMVDEFERRPDVGGIFGRVLPDGESASGIYLAVKDDPVRQEFRGEVDVHVGHGANMGFRGSLLESVGLFDELLGSGGILASCEDIDIRVRFLHRGHLLLYLPSSLLYHKQDRSWSLVRRLQQSYAIGAGACYGKYLRCGHLYGLRMLVNWFLYLGFREMLVGLILLRLPRVVNGWVQITYPWLGLVRGLRYSIDKEAMVYKPLSQAAPAAAEAPTPR